MKTLKEIEKALKEYNRRSRREDFDWSNAKAEARLASELTKALMPIFKLAFEEGFAFIPDHSKKFTDDFEIAGVSKNGGLQINTVKFARKCQ